MNCAGCGGPLSGRQRRWCSTDCSQSGARAGRLAAIFNLTTEQYDLILAEQGGVCAVCTKAPKAGVHMPVDHDHRTGFVRGAICHFCNLRVIGKHTDAALLQRAADYLRDPPARRALGLDVVAPGRPRRKRRPRKTGRKKAA